MTEASPAATGSAVDRARASLRAVDADLHHDFAEWAEIAPYVDAGLRHRLKLGRDRGLARHGFRRVGASPAGPNSDPAVVEQMLRERCIDRAVLTGTVFSLGVQPNMDLSSALARAINDWTYDKWLRPHDCFKGSILIAQQDAEAAAAEIDRLGENPAFVQVLMCSASEAPFGRRQYHPIYAACQRQRLPLALHIGGEGAGVSAPSTPVGHPNTYIEWYSALPQAYMAHLTSLISEGVFERFPGLRVVLCEGGLAWLPHVVWRFEKNFKAVRAETPWLTRLPSRYVWEHFRLTTYPLEELPRSSDWEGVLEMIHADRTVLFSSNYPYWEYGDPFAMLADFPEPYRRRIMVENALELYGDRLLAPNRTTGTPSG
ncbi:MAG TPA: amidohydrolase family protein [Chloroflexota bacterium]|jgi:predicted TIM-barrel fold metal-dependent hydrolase